MDKNRKHGAAFKLQLIQEHLRGEGTDSLAKKWGLSTSLVRRWVDHYSSSGNRGLLRQPNHCYSPEFKFSVVRSYREEGLSLRDCRLKYDLSSDSIILSWVKRYELSGLEGFMPKQRGRPQIMKKDIPPKNPKPLTRLEELEKENVYLRAENELLKKLEALTQQNKTPKKKR